MKMNDPAGQVNFAIVEEDDASAVEHVESLCGVPVHVHRWPESGTLAGFQRRERSPGRVGGRIDRHREVPEVDRPTFAGLKDEGSAL
jgi:hypothetical protein